MATGHWLQFYNLIQIGMIDKAVVCGVCGVTGVSVVSGVSSHW